MRITTLRFFAGTFDFLVISSYSSSSEVFFRKWFECKSQQPAIPDVIAI